MNEREEALRLVLRGAQLLDERAPGKLESVDHTNLYLSSCTKCVLGFIYGHVKKGMTELGLSLEDMKGYGFSDTLPGGVLGEAWRTLIAERKGIRYC